MITLAMACATGTVGIAFLDQRKILTEFYLDSGRGHTEILLPALERLFFLTGLTMERIDLLVCTTGPGSFTGVRIGVSTIKAWRSPRGSRSSVSPRLRRWP
jgi:tRNA threonylcarbamoyladenosine biosynthesis protein TsaB